jgi:fucose permease
MQVLPLAALISALGFALAAAKLPFPAMCIGFGLLGFGNTAQDALCNAYTAGLPRLDFQLAILHTFYGLGAATSPLIATVFVTHGRPFNLFFLTSVGISILNIASLCVAFKFQHQLEEPTAQSAEIELSGMARTASREGEQNGPEAEVSELPTVGQRQYHVPLLVALKVYYVPLGAFWFLL